MLCQAEAPLAKAATVRAAPIASFFISLAAQKRDTSTAKEMKKMYATTTSL